MMNESTILYISDRPNHGNSVLDLLKETGYEVVSTNSPTEGVALLYIMQSVIAVVLDSGVEEQASFKLAQSLRKIRPNVPVMLPCGDQIGSSPLSTEKCVRSEELPSALQRLLTAEAAV
jgi:DNA-binding NtrC family response regulator